MDAIYLLVPGFREALLRDPEIGGAWRRLADSVRDGTLDARASALVAIAVAERSGGPYARWIMSRMGAAAGLTAEEILLAASGCAADPIDDALAAAGWHLASPDLDERAAHARATDALLATEDFAEVVAHVALALVTCGVLDHLAPRAGSARTRRHFLR